MKVALSRTPAKSTRTASAELSISLQRILQADMHFSHTKLQKVKANDIERYVQFAAWVIAEGGAMLHNVWYSGEVYVYLNGSVNSRMPYFGQEKILL